MIEPHYLTDSLRGSNEFMYTKHLKRCLAPKCCRSVSSFYQLHQCNIPFFLGSAHWVIRLNRAMKGKCLRGKGSPCDLFLEIFSVLLWSGGTPSSRHSSVEIRGWRAHVPAAQLSAGDLPHRLAVDRKWRSKRGKVGSVSATPATFSKYSVVVRIHEQGKYSSL